MFWESAIIYARRRFKEEEGLLEWGCSYLLMNNGPIVDLEDWPDAGIDYGRI